MIMSSSGTLYKQVDTLIFPKRVLLASIYGPPELVWTMTKVGTTSIARSLQNKLGKYRVFGEHNLNDPNWPRSVTLHNEFIIKKRPVKIITAVRDPISQSVSNFFHKYTFYTGDSVTDPKLNINAMMDIFLKTRIDISWESWFEENIKKYLEVDIYDYPFSSDKGYLTLKKENFDILLLKTETDNPLKEEAIKLFLGLDSFVIEDQNVGDQKEYSKIYKAFKENAKFSNRYLENIRNSKYLNLFYSEKEIDLMFQRWSSGEKV